MRGLDCTDAQLDAADRFITEHPMRGIHVSRDQAVTVPYGEIVRVVAWYGALRYIAARDNSGGTLDNPADCIAANVTEVANG